MKRHTSAEWLRYFGIEMIDDDGWRANGQTHLGSEEFNLVEFMDRVQQSTILLISGEPYEWRRQTLDFISGRV